MSATTAGRMRGVPERPAGLVHHPDLLDDAQENALVAAVERYDFQQVVMHGQPARRTVRHFGFGYDYDSARAAPGDPLPPELVDLRERARCWPACRRKGWPRHWSPGTRRVPA